MGFLLDLLIEPLVNLVVAAVFWVIAFPLVFAAAAVPICVMSYFGKDGYWSNMKNHYGRLYAWYRKLAEEDDEKQ